MNTFLFIHLFDLFLPSLFVLWLTLRSRSVPSPGWRRPRPWSSRRSAGGSTTSSSRWLEASVDPRLHCLKYESNVKILKYESNVRIVRMVTEKQQQQQQQQLPCLNGLSEDSIVQREFHNLHKSNAKEEVSVKEIWFFVRKFGFSAGSWQWEKYGWESARDSLRWGAGSPIPPAPGTHSDLIFGPLWSPSLVPFLGGWKKICCMLGPNFHLIQMSLLRETLF